MRKEFFVFLVAASLISSCKRNGSQEDAQKDTGSIANKAQSWLEKQKQVNQPFRGKIQQLSDHLEWAMAKTESYANRNLFVIPINKGYLTLNNKGKDPANYLILFVNQKQEVAGGRVVQYVNSSGKTAMPEKAIVKILNNEDPGCEGSFSFTNIVDRFLYELKFSSGKKTDFVYMTPKVEKTEEAGKLQAAQCHDWYLITTQYNLDGTVEVWSDYLGRTCDGCTPISPTMEGSLCDEFQDETGGGIADECCMIGSNVSFQSSSQSIIEGRSCGPETVDLATGHWKTSCTYTWTYNTSSVMWVTWKYSSIEVAELEKMGPVWKFTSFTHFGTRRDGDTPSCMEFKDGVTAAKPTISADRMQARMDIQYWISSKVNCLPLASTQIKTMSSYANFPAA